MPSAVWLFSSKAAKIRGKASVLPFRVCAGCVFLPVSSLNRSFSRVAWNDSKLETEIASSRFCCADQFSSTSQELSAWAML
jgi:hypothetical protein